MKKRIDIIASFKNEEKNINNFVSRIKKSFRKYKNIDYKIIFIDDFSDDSSNRIIKKLRIGSKKIKLLTFIKNYGGSPSIQTGFDFVSSQNYVAVIDCDLQDPPELIAKNFSMIKKDETIHFVRKKRDDPLFQIIYTKIAYFLLYLISGGKIIMNSNHFKILPPKVVRKIKKNKEIYPYWNYLFTMYSIKNKLVNYNRKKRIHGFSKFTWLSLNPWLTYLSGFYYFKKNFLTTSLALISLNVLLLYVIFLNFHNLLLILMLTIIICVLVMNLLAFLFIMYYKMKHKRVICKYKL
uniref:Putative glycosyl transferase n=1 Tax=uncultured marine microorganism HF4000_007I05 TaxID=455511 RepID=B3T0X3_9ZZZZ|nr:putative glycosyl transferase [uncultured marine microorganism HF4000_007I05]